MGLTGYLPDDRDRVLEYPSKAVREGREYATELRIVLSDGTVRHIHAIGHPVFNASGELVGVVGTHVDITERKEIGREHERLRQLEAELAHVNRVSMLGELAASLSHELKQPIAAASMNAHAALRWLDREQPDLTEARKSILSIVFDARGAIEIMDRLRSFYKTGSPLERELVDVNEALLEMLAMLRNEADRHSVSMRTRAATGLPSVWADRVQIQQVLLNLMLNAIEAMKETGGELTIASDLGSDGQVLISVSDTGVGLPGDKADQIFKAFFTTKPQGSGMGLAISLSIVESHGGRLWAAANSGRGATFYFTLPTAARGVKDPGIA
jgi:signal transduction histidine kinase